MCRIETDRLVIRDHVAADSASLERLLMDERAMRYLPEIRCRTVDDACKNLETAMQEAENPHRTKYFFAIEAKENMEYVGEIGFTLVSSAATGGIANLGYFILPEHWGYGYTTEAASAVIDFAFQRLSLHKITSGCLAENMASERIMIKCGMVKEAEYKAHVFHKNTWKDRVEYRLLQEEWRKLPDKSLDRTA
jgi:[ribosomal protein S5]-alanine N-acetyltransferase